MSEAKREYQTLLNQQKRRNERNVRLLTKLENIEKKAAFLQAKTDRIKSLKSIYKNQFSKPDKIITTRQYTLKNEPSWKIREPDLQNYRQYDYPRSAYYEMPFKYPEPVCVIKDITLEDAIEEISKRFILIPKSTPEKNDTAPDKQWSQKDNKTYDKNQYEDTPRYYDDIDQIIRRNENFSVKDFSDFKNNYEEKRDEIINNNVNENYDPENVPQDSFADDELNGETSQIDEVYKNEKNKKIYFDEPPQETNSVQNSAENIPTSIHIENASMKQNEEENKNQPPDNQQINAIEENITITENIEEKEIIQDEQNQSSLTQPEENYQATEQIVESENNYYTENSQHFNVEQPYVEQSYVEQSYVEPYVEQAYVEQPFVQQPYDEQSYVEQSSVEQPYEEQPYVEQQSVEQPYSDEQQYIESTRQEEENFQQPYDPESYQTQDQQNIENVQEQVSDIPLDQYNEENYYTQNVEETVIDSTEQNQTVNYYEQPTYKSQNVINEEQTVISDTVNPEAYYNQNETQPYDENQADPNYYNQENQNYPAEQETYYQQNYAEGDQAQYYYNNEGGDPNYYNQEGQETNLVEAPQGEYAPPEQYEGNYNPADNPQYYEENTTEAQPLKILDSDVDYDNSTRDDQSKLESDFDFSLSQQQ